MKPAPRTAPNQAMDGRAIVVELKKFFEDNPSIDKASSLGIGDARDQYLRNRIEKAFLAGFEAYERQSRSFLFEKKAA